MIKSSSLVPRLLPCKKEPGYEAKSPVRYLNVHVTARISRNFETSVKATPLYHKQISLIQKMPTTNDTLYGEEAMKAPSSSCTCRKPSHICPFRLNAMACERSNVSLWGSLQCDNVDCYCHFQLQSCQNAPHKEHCDLPNVPVGKLKLAAILL